jgi:signal transduction histidine kinase
MAPDSSRVTDRRRRVFLLSGLLAAVGISLLVATQNYFALATRGRPTPWLPLFLGELPVWFAWLAMLPAITWLARRFPPHRERPALHVGIHVIAGCAAVYIMILFTEGVRRLMPGMLPVEGSLFDAVNRSFPFNLVPFLIVYAAAAALAVAWQYHWALQAQQIRESQLQTQLARTRLDVLRAQIQPHFLFNTLHAISALMGRDVNGARRMMRRLSELLRIALDDSGGDEVPLAAELQFLDGYLDIQRLRFGDRLNVTLEIGEGTRSLPVPRLILQPLVENSIKHGITARPQAENITIRAERTGSGLLLRVADDGPGFRTDAGHLPESGFTSGGLGLANTRERLRGLYGDEGSLLVQDDPDGGAVVEIRIPIRTESNE